MPEEFDNKGYTPKTQQMFAVHTMLEKFENLTFQSGNFLWLSKTQQGNHDIQTSNNQIIACASGLKAL